jgi:ABC-type Zn uptake system ZnuABC Zn-binding protein ZnuA
VLLPNPAHTKNKMGIICKLGRSWSGWAIFLAFTLVTGGCSHATHPEPTTSQARLRVLVTISTFVSFAKAVAGERADVATLVPVGASPEEFQPTPADIERVHAADILVENGLGLETWLARTIDNAKNDRLTTVIATDGLVSKAGNPHLWMDPELARGYVRAIEAALVARIATIPVASRSMIVFHNAWQYYDDRFGLRTIGVLELSPGQEPNPKYVNDLVGLARTNHVRAIFAEPEYNPKLVRTLAQSAGIATVENLYDDSIGSDPRVTDYESMLRFDTETIVAALGGSHA